MRVLLVYDPATGLGLDEPIEVCVVNEDEEETTIARIQQLGFRAMARTVTPKEELIEYLMGEDE